MLRGRRNGEVDRGPSRLISRLYDLIASAYVYDATARRTPMRTLWVKLVYEGQGIGSDLAGWHLAGFEGRFQLRLGNHVTIQVRPTTITTMTTA